MRSPLPHLLLPCALARRPHLVKALGATYATLGLLALAASTAPSWQRVLSAQCFTIWSLAQVMSSAAAFHSPADAERRFAFHGMLIGLNLLCCMYELARKRPP